MTVCNQDLPEKKCPKVNCRRDNCCGCPFRKVVIPAAAGDDETGTVIPENGLFVNALVEYEANGSMYIYASDGIFTRIGSNSKSEEAASVAYVDTQILNTKRYVDEEVDDDSDVIEGVFGDFGGEFRANGDSVIYCHGDGEQHATLSLDGIGAEASERAFACTFITRHHYVTVKETACLHKCGLAFTVHDEVDTFGQNHVEGEAVEIVVVVGQLNVDGTSFSCRNGRICHRQAVGCVGGKHACQPCEH